MLKRFAKYCQYSAAFFSEFAKGLLPSHTPFAQTVRHLNAPDDQKHWGNLGYWVSTNNQAFASNYSAAAQALADELIPLTVTDDVETMLVLGCGGGEELRHWRQSLTNLAYMEAWDTDDASLALAKTKSSNLQSTFEHRSAEYLAQSIPTGYPAQKGQAFDLISALDCAYHFQNRSDIWRGAFSSLSAHGCLSISDLVARECRHDLTFSQRTWLQLASILFSIPNENWVTAKDYQADLKRIGFNSVQVHECGEAVLDGFVRFTQSDRFNRDLPKTWQVKSLITAWLVAQLRKRKLIGYVIIQAKKSPN